jgi:GT2 family glycosyltransferase
MALVEGIPACRMSPHDMFETDRPLEKGGKAITTVSVIIVNYNSGALLTEAVASALDSSLPVEVIVSDNGSIDDSVRLLRKTLRGVPNLSIFENGENLGFALGNNRVLPKSVGEYLLFLNPDCLIEPDTLARMTEIMESQPDVGMAGCLIRNLDGSEQPGCRRYIPTPWRALMRVVNPPRFFSSNPRFQDFNLLGTPLPDRPVEVEAISGAFMFVRRSALEKVGPLDEGYFLHCEDLDWCMRFKQAGYRILFVPDVVISHVKGGCSVNRPVFVEWHKHRGMIRFYRKFFRQRYPGALMWLVFAAVWTRFLVKALVLTLKQHV